jgi:group I intron endonuclease
MEKKFHYVYLTTNLVNGKQYVGDHSTNNINDGYLGSGNIILDAIKKYGKNNFKLIILESFNTKEDAFNAQEKYISNYNTLVPNGYNVSARGGANCKKGLSKESIEKLRKTLSNSIKGKSHSKEWNEKVSNDKCRYN